jgi:hypothetical protein
VFTWPQRAAAAGDDPAFGKWIAKHSLDAINQHDRALINIGKHSEIAATALRRTSSHSPRPTTAATASQAMDGAHLEVARKNHAAWHRNGGRRRQNKLSRRGR